MHRVFCWILLAAVSLACHLQPLHAQAPSLSLASDYRPGLDLPAYFVSEKLDGVRAYWDGRQLTARSGNTIRAPAWFIADFPATALDGELWIARGRFDELSGIVRQIRPDSADWHLVRYMVFDLPHATQPFTHRLAQLQQVISLAEIPWLQPVSQFRVTDEAALMKTLARVTAGGGEGLMLRRDSSLYHTQRNSDLMKLKPLHDAEAIVLAYLPGRGRLKGMMGSLLVETSEGRRFRIGTGFSDMERRNPPPLGATITYQFSGLTSTGLPRFARYLRVRDDL